MNTTLSIINHIVLHIIEDKAGEIIGVTSELSRPINKPKSERQFATGTALQFFSVSRFIFDLLTGNEIILHSTSSNPPQSLVFLRH